MDYQRFYARLFAPLETHIGPLDWDTLFAIIGFDCGGPLNFSTIGYTRGERFITYVSCELAARPQQRPSKLGRYELLCSCDDERWVRSIVSDIGRESFKTTFEHGHTLDIGTWVEPRASIQGVLLEKVCRVKIEDRPFGILRVIGITRPELQYRLRNSSRDLLTCLKRSGVYPNTVVNRASIV
ncbi:MAG: suppressor of fused domain protein [Gemmataceae bacterium]